MEEVLDCVPPGSRHTVQGFLLMQHERIEKLEDQVKYLTKMIAVLDAASADVSWDLYCSKGNILDVCKKIQQVRPDISFLAKKGDIENNQVTLLGTYTICPALLHTKLKGLEGSEFWLVLHSLTVAEHERMSEVQLDSTTPK